VAALVHALARRAAEEPLRETAPDQALHWSSFRAVRDGLDAELLFRGRLRPARAAVRELLDELRGEDDALQGVERILRDGGAPTRQRAIHAEGGMPALLRHLADETARPLR
jgi:carboxylate-amine ligase